MIAWTQSVFSKWPAPSNRWWPECMSAAGLLRQTNAGSQHLSCMLRRIIPQPRIAPFRAFIVHTLTQLNAASSTHTIHVLAAALQCASSSIGHPHHFLSAAYFYSRNLGLTPSRRARDMMFDFPMHLFHQITTLVMCV